MTKAQDAVVVGNCWSPEKAAEADRLIKRAGQTGSKVSVPRIAKKAGVAEAFVRSLRVAVEDGEDGWTDRDTDELLRVLDALGVELGAFEDSVGFAHVELDDEEGPATAAEAGTVPVYGVALGAST